MILAKLEDALTEIPVQRKALDEVETQLRAMIAKLKGTADLLQSAVTPQAGAIGRQIPLHVNMPPSGQKDKIDEVADILRAEGRPLHITRIAEALSANRKIKIDRTTLEPGLNRHIAKTKSPKIAKFAPSTFGLPEWKAEPIAPALAQMAS